MKYSGKDHTYVICAFQESEYLEECICSLNNQEVKSNIIMVTSTPNEFLHALCEKYEMPLYRNPGTGGICGDWNFGLSMAETPIVTIAHQDDVYEPWYTKKVLEYMNKGRHPLIFFSDYGEIRNGVREVSNHLLNVKRMMLLPLRPRWTSDSIFLRRRVLSFGSPISCPTVSYFLPNLPQKIFAADYKSDLDWQAWEKISRLKGDFLFCKEICMYHRIHEESTTTEVLQKHGRHREDLEMFMKFWPKIIAHILEWFYQNSEKSNEMEKKGENESN